VRTVKASHFMQISLCDALVSRACMDAREKLYSSF
jgi:hypothetical protein